MSNDQYIEMDTKYPRTRRLRVSAKKELELKLLYLLI